jgi:hypothetical protein
LTYPQPFRDRLQALLKIVHFQVDESSWQDTVVDFVTHKIDLRFLLKEITEAFVEIAMHLVDCLYRGGLAWFQQWF